MSGPRTTNSSGSLEATLGVDVNAAKAIGGTICPPGPGERPPVPDALDPEPTPGVGAIGAQFSVSAGGTATYSIPLALPPGRAGIEPHLSISYDSAGGNGLLGLRFSLAGFSRISRCGRDIVRDGQHQPPAFAATDAFCLDGQRLVEWQDAGSSDVWYSTEAESFARVRPQGAGPDSFVVESSDGRILEYGTSDDSRVYGRRVGETNAIRAWSLRRVRDRSGNWMEYRYQSDRDDTGATREQVPDKIVYTGSDASPPLAPNREVRFDYVKPQRKDTLDGWLLGSHTQRTKLLDSISISGPSPSSTGDHGQVELART